MGADQSKDKDSPPADPNLSNQQQPLSNAADPSAVHPPSNAPPDSNYAGGGGNSGERNGTSECNGMSAQGELTSAEQKERATAQQQHQLVVCAYSDIPFTLSPALRILAERDASAALLNSGGGGLREIDWNLYLYDFHLERSMLL